MSSLTDALRGKISILEDEKEELEDALNRVVIKLETYEELLVEEEEGGTPAPASPTSKKKRGRGRPKGAKNKKTAAKESAAPRDELWEQAESSLPAGFDGTSPEEQERALRRFNPTARPAPNYGVKAGTPEEVMGAKDDVAKKSHTNVTVED